MNSDAPSRRTRWGGWLPLWVFITIYGIVMCVVLTVRVESTSDFRDFWENAQALRAHGEIRSDLGVHNYLPFFTIFMGPFAWLPLRAAAVVFTLLSFGLLALTILMTESLLHDGWGPKPRKATLITLALMLAYIHSCGVLGQIGLFLLFLITTAWFLVERGHEWTAGVALGLATLIKVLPAALIVFFLLKLRWRVASSAILTGFLLGLGLPAASLGIEKTMDAHRAFHRSAIVEHGARTTIFQDTPHKAKYSNNALPIVLRRLLSPLNGDPSDRDRERRLLVNLTDWSPQSIWYAYLILMTVFAGSSIIVCMRNTRPWPPRTPAGKLSVRAQYGVWCCLMILAAPLVWTHYLVLTYWPLALAVDQVAKRCERTRRLFSFLSVVLIVWLLGAVFLAWPAARSAGAQLWSVAALWLGMLTLATNRLRTSNIAESTIRS